MYDSHLNLMYSGKYFLFFSLFKFRLYLSFSFSSLCKFCCILGYVISGEILLQVLYREPFCTLKMILRWSNVVIFCRYNTILFALFQCLRLALIKVFKGSFQTGQLSEKVEINTKLRMVKWQYLTAVFYRTVVMVAH